MFSQLKCTVAMCCWGGDADRYGLTQASYWPRKPTTCFQMRNGLNGGCVIGMVKRCYGRNFSLFFNRNSMWT